MDTSHYGKHTPQDWQHHASHPDAFAFSQSPSLLSHPVQAIPAQARMTANPLHPAAEYQALPYSIAPYVRATGLQQPTPWPLHPSHYPVYAPPHGDYVVSGYGFNPYLVQAPHIRESTAAMDPPEDKEEGYFKRIALSEVASQLFIISTNQLLPLPAGGAPLSYQALVWNNPVTDESDEQWHITGIHGWQILMHENLVRPFKPHVQRYCSDMHSSLRALLSLILPRGYSGEAHPALYHPNLQYACDEAAHYYQGRWHTHLNGAVTFSTAASHLSLIPIESSTSLARHATDDLQVYPLSRYVLSPVSKPVAQALFALKLTITTPYTQPQAAQTESSEWLTQGTRLGQAVGSNDQRTPLDIPSSRTLLKVIHRETGHDYFAQQIRDHLQQQESLLTEHTLELTHASHAEDTNNKKEATRWITVDKKTKTVATPNDLDIAPVINTPDKTPDPAPARPSGYTLRETLQPPDSASTSPAPHDTDQSAVLARAPEMPKAMQPDNDAQSQTSETPSTLSEMVAAKPNDAHAPLTLLPRSNTHRVANTRGDTVDWSALNTLAHTKKWIKSQPDWPAPLIQTAAQQAPLPVRATLCAHLIEHHSDPFSLHQPYQPLLKWHELLALLIDPHAESSVIPYALSPHSRGQLENYQLAQPFDSPKNQIIRYLGTDPRKVAQVFANSKTKTWSAAEKALLKKYFMSSPWHSLMFFHEMWKTKRLASDYLPVSALELALAQKQDEALLQSMLTEGLGALQNDSAVNRYRQLMPLIITLKDHETGWEELHLLALDARKKPTKEWHAAITSLDLNRHVVELSRHLGSHWYFLRNENATTLKIMINELPGYHEAMSKIKNNLETIIQMIPSIQQHPPIKPGTLTTIIEALTHSLLLFLSEVEQDNEAELLFKTLALSKIDGRYLHEHLEHYITGIFNDKEYSQNNKLSLITSIQQIVVMLYQHVADTMHGTTALQSLVLKKIHLNIYKSFFCDVKQEPFERINELCKMLNFIPSQLEELCLFTHFDTVEQHAEYLQTVPASFLTSLLSRTPHSWREYFTQILVTLYHSDGQDEMIAAQLTHRLEKAKEQLTDGTIDHHKGKELLMRLLSVPTHYLPRWPTTTVKALHDLFEQAQLL